GVLVISVRSIRKWGQVARRIQLVKGARARHHKRSVASRPTEVDHARDGLPSLPARVGGGRRDDRHEGQTGGRHRDHEAHGREGTLWGKGISTTMLKTSNTVGL